MRKKTWWHDRRSPPRLGECGTGRATIGPWWMSMEQSRRPDNGHFPRPQTFLLLIAALTWSLHPDTWDASGEKSHARERRSCKLIPTNGSRRSETWAMAITGENDCGPER